jgi:hypothetical protein
MGLPVHLNVTTRAARRPPVKTLGRLRKLSPEPIARAREVLRDSERTNQDVALELGVSPRTLARGLAAP